MVGFRHIQAASPAALVDSTRLADDDAVGGHQRLEIWLELIQLCERMHLLAELWFEADARLAETFEGECVDPAQLRLPFERWPR